MSASTNVISMREWCAARARNAKVRRLISAIDRYCAGQGPHDAVALAMVARRLTNTSWAIVEEMAGETSPSSALTRQLVLDHLEDEARALRLERLEQLGSSS
jgi:hypothetical protein